ncbi:hypothetical protein, partial [Rhodoferax sp. BLA1]|uniref:hypothetical protein n=1 Tax=Rhodoferax sp. BLA1 TaxID=2576062 RepID=UPI001C554357
TSHQTTTNTVVDGHDHHGSDEFVSPNVNATFVEIFLPPRLLGGLTVLERAFRGKLCQELLQSIATSGGNIGRNTHTT